MFEDCVERLKNEPVEEGIELNYLNNVSLNLDALISKLKNLDDLSDKELSDIIKESYPLILEDMIEHKSLLVKLFTNKRFLTIMSRDMYSIQLTTSQRIRCNKISYDYITSKQLEKDDMIKSLLINLSKVVNRDIIPGLLSLNLSEELSSYLAMARYSSDKETINVKRVNFIIINQSLSLMTEQKIINIYEKLFTHITPLFEGIMFEHYELEGNSAEIYSTISLAILDILNEMPISMIKAVLKSFAQNKTLLHPDDKIRFDLRTISRSDYSRICSVLDVLEKENIFIF